MIITPWERLNLLCADVPNVKELWHGKIFCAHPASLNKISVMHVCYIKLAFKNYPTEIYIYSISSITFLPYGCIVLLNIYLVVFYFHVYDALLLPRGKIMQEWESIIYAHIPSFGFVAYKTQRIWCIVFRQNILLDTYQSSHTHASLMDRLQSRKYIDFLLKR